MWENSEKSQFHQIAVTLKFLPHKTKKESKSLQSTKWSLVSALVYSLYGTINFNKTTFHNSFLRYGHFSVLHTALQLLAFSQDSQISKYFNVRGITEIVFVCNFSLRLAYSHTTVKSNILCCCWLNKLISYKYVCLFSLFIVTSLVCQVFTVITWYVAVI